MLLKLAKCRASEAGIMIADAFKYYQDSANNHSNPWWKQFVPSVSSILFSLKEKKKRKKKKG